MTGEKTTKIAATVVIVLVLGMVMAAAVSAWANRPRAGEVIAQWLIPAHSETYQSGSVCGGYDKNGGCTVSIPIFSTRWVADRCYVRIRTDEAKPRTADWTADCANVPAMGAWVHGG